MLASLCTHRSPPGRFVSRRTNPALKIAGMVFGLNRLKSIENAFRNNERIGMFIRIYNHPDDITVVAVKVWG
jgi:hypothetical protein